MASGEAYQSFNARAGQIGADKVAVTGTATIDGKQVTWSYDAAYNAISCGTPQKPGGKPKRSSPLPKSSCALSSFSAFVQIKWLMLSKVLLRQMQCEDHMGVSYRRAAGWWRTWWGSHWLRRASRTGGATGPSSFDYSGLAMKAYAAAGVRIPRTTFEQWPFASAFRLARSSPAIWCSSTADRVVRRADRAMSGSSWGRQDGRGPVHSMRADHGCVLPERAAGDWVHPAVGDRVEEVAARGPVTPAENGSSSELSGPAESSLLLHCRHRLTTSSAWTHRHRLDIPSRIRHSG